MFHTSVYHKIDPNISVAANDLLTQLLQRDPTKRPTIEQIKSHNFFKNLHWNVLLQSNYIHNESPILDKLGLHIIHSPPEETAAFVNLQEAIQYTDSMNLDLIIEKMF